MWDWMARTAFMPNFPVWVCWTGKQIRTESRISRPMHTVDLQDCDSIFANNDHWKEVFPRFVWKVLSADACKEFKVCLFVRNKQRGAQSNSDETALQLRYIKRPWDRSLKPTTWWILPPFWRQSITSLEHGRVWLSLAVLHCSNILKSSSANSSLDALRQKCVISLKGSDPQQSWLKKNNQSEAVFQGFYYKRYAWSQGSYLFCRLDVKPSIFVIFTCGNSLSEFAIGQL